MIEILKIFRDYTRPRNAISSQTLSTIWTRQPWRLGVVQHGLVSSFLVESPCPHLGKVNKISGRMI